MLKPECVSSSGICVRGVCVLVRMGDCVLLCPLHQKLAFSPPSGASGLTEVGAVEEALQHPPTGKVDITHLLAAGHPNSLPLHGIFQCESGWEAEP